MKWQHLKLLSDSHVFFLIFSLEIQLKFKSTSVNRDQLSKKRKVGKSLLILNLMFIPSSVCQSQINTVWGDIIQSLCEKLKSISQTTHLL